MALATVVWTEAPTHMSSGLGVSIPGQVFAQHANDLAAIFAKVRACPVSCCCAFDTELDSTCLPRFRVHPHLGKFYATGKHIVATVQHRVLASLATAFWAAYTRSTSVFMASFGWLLQAKKMKQSTQHATRFKRHWPRFGQGGLFAVGVAQEVDYLPRACIHELDHYC